MGAVEAGAFGIGRCSEVTWTLCVRIWEKKPGGCDWSTILVPCSSGQIERQRVSRHKRAQFEFSSRKADPD
jgi:hypothetical protein